MRRAALVGMAIGLALSVAPAMAQAQSTPKPAAPTASAKAVPKAAPKAAPKRIVKSNSWDGTWTGSLAQVGRGKPFPFELTLAGYRGTTSYPDDQCTGKLLRVGVRGNYAFFTETITKGKLDPATKKGCLDGSLTLEKDNGSLTMSWMTAHDGKAIVAYGTLTRTK